MSTNWIARASNFNVSSSLAVGAAGVQAVVASTNPTTLNIATVYGIVDADIGAQTDLGAMAVGQTLGVVTRFSGGLPNASMYIGSATYTTAVTPTSNGVLTVRIYVVVNGAVKQEYSAR